MLTFDDARRVIEEHLRAHPPGISGTLYVSPEGFEDETHYLPVWGAREFLVDGQDAYGRWDSRVLFVDKQSGEVTEDIQTLAFDKIDAMTPVRASE
jgi:hypothetical protein